MPAVILAGGLATRMGGGDKCLRRLGGRPILSHVLAQLEPQCDPILLSANGDPARFQPFGLEVASDTFPEEAGPLAGLLAGLDWAAARGAGRLISVAADAPFQPPDLVGRLCAAAGQGSAIAASPGADGRMRRHPVVGLWRVEAREALRAALGQSLRKAGLWADMQEAATAAWASDPVDPFFNVNRSEDLEEAERLLAGSR